MKLNTPFLILIVVLQINVSAQDQTNLKLQPLSAHDSLVMSRVPPLTLADNILKRSLPTVVDNSALPFFRPLVAQVGLECGQASSIGIMFTYELNAKRKVPGNLPENQQVPHFTYNFLNSGSNAGINYIESFEIVKFAGNPNVADYGGMSTGGPSRWMSGYDKYFNAMKNRIEGVYSINTSTVNGLNTLRNWIYDHGNASQYGGMASFYSQFTNPPNDLPSGTPEAGRSVIVQWGSSPDHAMSIVGYNDLIRWDYNGDGQYTNHIDINGDGNVDVRDWEIGGFKMANTYGSISGWGDQGFAYMMYKTLAESSTQGGIWNNQVIVVDAKKEYKPLLTAKVTLTYPCRNKLKLIAGVSTNLLDTSPENMLQFPMFDFQGGCYPMQGISSSQTIEIGLDLNPLLAYVQPGQQAKFFLMLVENDQPNSSAGVINGFSIIDYTGVSPVETSAAQTNVAILNNTSTLMSVQAAVNYSAVSISTSEIPPFQLYSNNQVQMQASGGESPYYWNLLYAYDTIRSTATMPIVMGSQLTVSNNNDGFATVDLPFDFPFYGKKYRKIYPTADGFIRFEPTEIPWPYYIEDKTYFKQTRCIAPSLSKNLLIKPTAGDHIRAEIGQTSVIIRWKLSVYGVTGDSEVSMTATLHNDGRIEFHYGTHLAPSYTRKFAGLSAGDGENFVFLNKIGTFTPTLNQYNKFTPQQEQSNISLSKNGLLQATLNEFVPNQTIALNVADINNLRKTTNFNIAVTGVIMNYNVNAGANSIIENGENISFDFEFKNVNGFNLGAGSVSITTSDPHFQILNGTASVASLNIGETHNIANVFNVKVSSNVPNGHKATFLLKYQTMDGIWTRPITLTAYAPDIQLLTITVNDGGNGILEPGETAQIVLNLRNDGGVSLQDIVATLSTAHPHFTVLNGTATHTQMQPLGTWNASFQVQLSAAALPMQVVELLLQVSAANGYQYSKTIPLMTSLIVETFESGGFTMFPWEMSGQTNWTLSNVAPYQGLHSARSGVINHSNFSTLAITYNVAFPDTLSFFYKVSSENNYDFLKFSINGVQKTQWSGEKPWKRVAYWLAAGPQTLRWRYEKDNTISSGSDCAWLDFIVFPARHIYTSLSEQDGAAGYSIHISPNPFKGSANVTVKAFKDEVFRIMVVDAKGRLLCHLEQQGKANETYQFDHIIKSIGQGNYFIVLQSSSQTIVKQLIRTGK